MVKNNSDTPQYVWPKSKKAKSSNPDSGQMASALVSTEADVLLAFQISVNLPFKVF